MARFNVIQFIREQWKTLPVCSGDVSSKAIMLTGTNVGIGLEAAVHFAGMKPQLLLATCRDEEKCKRTREDNYPEDSTKVASWPLNLNTFDSVREFADRFAAEALAGAQLNILVANAGVYMQSYTKTRDGWELMLQVNYLSTALLSILMLPYLIKSSNVDSPSRLVVVSSLGHYFGSRKLTGTDKWTSILGTINDENFCGSIDRYVLSKLLDVMFIRELVARLPEPTPVVACTVNPGFCRSRLFRDTETKWYTRPFASFLNYSPLSRTSEEGSRTLLHAAIGGEDSAIHGRYLSGCEVLEESSYLFTPEGKAFSGRLWTETVDLLSKVDNRVPGIIKQNLRVD
ncbi:short-chain dehydrogenase [Scleroderma citrinum]